MAVSDITILIIAGYLISIIIMQNDKLSGNIALFLTSLSTLLVVTGNEAIIAVLLSALTLGNVILSIAKAQK